MKLVDENIKKSTQNKTIGIIISKEQDKLTRDAKILEDDYNKK